jgi:hypothetical protein
VDDALDARSKTHDAAGGDAALAREEAGTLSKGDARDHLQDPIDAWRAVGARALVRDEDQAARVRAFVDGSPAVRRAALHAAVEARDARDVPALAEAARVDPELLARTDAVRALGAAGGVQAFQALRDLGPTADEPLREDIASAYASAGVWDAGGREELRVIVASGHGPSAIDAAGAVLSRAPRGGGDAEVEASAMGLLARSIATGLSRDRLHAIAVAPFSIGGLAEAVRAAAAKADDDVTVRVAALARLAEQPESSPDRAPAIAALEAIAGDKDRAAAASRAKLALATARDLRIQAWLEADLASPEASARLGAARALGALGRPARAAPLLADADPSVRTRAACAILLAARLRK